MIRASLLGGAVLLACDALGGVLPQGSLLAFAAARALAAFCAAWLIRLAGPRSVAERLGLVLVAGLLAWCAGPLAFSLAAGAGAPAGPALRSLGGALLSWTLAGAALCWTLRPVEPR